MSERQTPENDAPRNTVDVICDHAGPCRSQQSGCRWVQFEREYAACDCGGWDERWMSRDKSLRLAGRAHHRRACTHKTPEQTSVTPPGSGDAP